MNVYIGLIIIISFILICIMGVKVIKNKKKRSIDFSIFDHTGWY